MSLASTDPARSRRAADRRRAARVLRRRSEAHAGPRGGAAAARPGTLELAPVRARADRRASDGDARFKLELPAAQLEIVTQPAADVPAGDRASWPRAAPPCSRARRRARPGPRRAGVHPFSAGEGELLDEPRYRRTVEQFGRDRAPPARLGAAGARGRGRGGAHARGLQRAALLPAGAGRAGRQPRPFHEGVDTRPGVDPPEDLARCCRARASRRRIASWDDFARRPALGRAARRTCRSTRPGGGSCARTRRCGHARAARARRAGHGGRRRPRSPPSRTALVALAGRRATTPARSWRATRSGASPRTAGRPAATASRARWPTCADRRAHADPRAAARA